MPETGVKLGSGAPIRTRRRALVKSRNLTTRWVPSHLELTVASQ
jgi:hypothetical protein